MSGSGRWIWPVRSLGIPGPFEFPHIPKAGPGMSGFGWARMRELRGTDLWVTSYGRAGRPSSKQSKIHIKSPRQRPATPAPGPVE